MRPWVKTANIPTQIHVHLAYADIYFFKEVIEKAGGTDNIDRLIRAMEANDLPRCLHSTGSSIPEWRKDS